MRIESPRYRRLWLRRVDVPSGLDGGYIIRMVELRTSPRGQVFRRGRCDDLEAFLGVYLEPGEEVHGRIAFLVEGSFGASKMDQPSGGPSESSHPSSSDRPGRNRGRGKPQEDSQ